MEKELLIKKVIQLCEENKLKGLRDDVLNKTFKLKAEEKIEILNELLENDLISIEQTANKELVYFYKDPKESEYIRGLSEDEILIYNTIEGVQYKGIGNLELKSKVGMNPQQIRKIIVKLEKKGFIKSFKPINSKIKKLWIISTLNPTDEMTGGIWYTDSNIDQDLLDHLTEKISLYITHKGRCTKEDVIISLKNLKTERGQIKDEHIISVLQIMLLDGDLIEISNPIQKENPSYEVYSKTKKFFMNKTPEFSICSRCPVQKECSPFGIISPKTCIYFNSIF